MTRTTRSLLYGFEAALLRYERLSGVPCAIRSVSDSLCEARTALEKRIELLEAASPSVVPAESEARTVKVRIAVAVDLNGFWCASGSTGNEPESDQLDARAGVPGDDEAVFWVTAELPIPGAPPEVKGKVEQ